MNSVILKAGRERSVERRHPWVFSGAIAAEGEIAAGEMVSVKSAAGVTLGHGWYSPASQIRIRMLDFAKDPPAPEVAALVGASVGRRAGFFGDDYTDAFRLINAENDGLPGVVADYYAGYVVIQLTSAGADSRRGEIVAAIGKYVPFCRGVSERLDLKDREKEGLEMAVDGRGWRNLEGEEPPERIVITEGPCKFRVDIRHGHKTGFYLDQREARRLVGSLANGCEVLNCFAYTGGFGLFAKAAGAMKVTQVDISAEALAIAKENELFVPGGETEMEYVEADVFEFLRKCRDAGRKFDLIVLDPPKFAAVKSQVMKAARGYKDINLLAMKSLKPNGYLATFSCSGAMTGELFEQVLVEAAEDAQRSFQVIARTRQGPDHPVALSFPEGLYLKGAVLRAVN